MERKDLNEHLKAKGLNIFGQPLYKLVWSSSELELRHGTFREFHDDVFIREVTETRWTKKYWYINERWILERWIPAELCNTAELPNSTQGSYEPIYVFEDGHRFYLEPNIKVLDFIVTMAEKPHRITKEEIFNEIKDKEDKEVQAIVDAMDYRSDIGVQLHLGSARGFGPKGKDNREKLN